MIRSTKIRWLTYKEDMEHLQSWDKKEEYLNRNSRSRVREAVEFRRSRSRSRGISIDNFGDISRDRSRDGCGKFKDESRKTEQVMW